MKTCNGCRLVIHYIVVYIAYRVISSIYATKISSQVIELNENFLQAKKDGLWFVGFYAPWCAYCKRLMPVWEHVGHALADQKSPVRVAKLDCTRYISTASALNIRGYPTIIFFRNGKEMSYEGERKKEAIIDFAIKASGPVIGIIEDVLQLSQPFFVYVEDSKDTHSTELFDTISVAKLPSVIVFKDNEYLIYPNEGKLIDWIHSERWSLIPLVTSANIKDVGKMRKLVLAVVNMVERKNDTTAVGKFVFALSVSVRKDPYLSKNFQFGWLDGNEIANNIVLGTVNVPSLLVFNISSYEYYSYSDPASIMTEKSIISLLERIAANGIEPRGGRSLLQRIKRILFELFTNIAEMFRAQPMLTLCLFGVPLSFLSLITYCICSTDLSVDRDEIYPDEDDDSSDPDENHQKEE
ncbi:unnamed protein product [Thelazia callipaeda]|uniref:Thioredoxin domain-containing protein n=1 Tax=Thelazia callipaeda TaxID=103827 RepID=A0A158RBL5_THECL|nr:unnamed protein product [Thelazia callipaeda]